MGKLRLPIAATLAAIVIAGHAVLLPALYFSLAGAVQRSHENSFVNGVRTFSRLLADHFELGDELNSPQLARDLLDTVILNSDGAYAELIDNGKVTRSDLVSPALRFPAREDYSFGAAGDHIYFIRLPISRPGHSAELRLGYDERPTSAAIAVALRRMLWTLIAYLGVSMTLAIALGYWLSRPVRRLQIAAHNIAGGAYSEDLRLSTRVSELHNLGETLDQMRSELLGISQRLRAEMRDRELAEMQRTVLEQRLQHRQRLETVGTLAGGIAHEFNNLLVPITLLTEFTIKKLPASHAQRPDLEVVLAAARRARDVVRQVLTFSREMGGASPQPVDLADVVREAMRLFTPLIAPTVRLRVDLDSPCALVRADRSLAVQLVMNLCTNAYQALQGLAGEVSVELREVSGSSAVPGGLSDAGRFVQLRIRDTGHGMDAATLKRIFEPFYTTRSVGEGTGLGLSVVHGIVESFGASIVVDSKEGEGSSFQVLFPIAETRGGSVPGPAGVAP